MLLLTKLTAIKTHFRELINSNDFLNDSKILTKDENPA